MERGTAVLHRTDRAFNVIEKAEGARAAPPGLAPSLSNFSPRIGNRAAFSGEIGYRPKRGLQNAAALLQYQPHETLG